MILSLGRELQVSAVPDAIENLAIGEDPDVDVGHDNLVLPGLFLVAEECVWHPDLGRISQGQVFQPTFKIYPKAQARVQGLLLDLAQW